MRNTIGVVALMGAVVALSGCAHTKATGFGKIARRCWKPRLAAGGLV